MSQDAASLSGSLVLRGILSIVFGVARRVLAWPDTGGVSIHIQYVHFD